MKNPEGLAQALACAFLLALPLMAPKVGWAQSADATLGGKAQPGGLRLAGKWTMASAGPDGLVIGGDFTPTGNITCRARCA